MEELLHELSQAIDGLLVQCETDAPLSLFVWPELLKSRSGLQGRPLAIVSLA